MSEQKQAIITSCRDCIFAEYDGPTQRNCTLGRLYPFQNNGAEVYQIEDDEKTFYQIVGRFCNMCRNHDWGNRHPRQKWREITEYESAIRVCMIIYVDNSTSFSDFVSSLRSIVSQTLKPHSLIVVLNNPQEASKKYLHTVMREKLNYPWEVRDMVEDDELGRPDRGRAIDIVVSKCNSIFYCVSSAGYSYNENFLADLNTAINTDMKRFVAVLPDEDGNRLVVQTGLHNFIKGNTNIPILDKLKEISQEENTQHMIATHEDIVPCKFL